MRIRSSWAAVMLLVAAHAPDAQVRPAPQTVPPPTSRATLVNSVEGISEYLFPNGLRVLLFPDSSKPTVTVNATYFVGSRQEGYGENGMAHLVEHFLFKSTRKFPDVKAVTTQRGARSNGTTDWDYTNYHETLPATDANLEWALELQTERMVNAVISREVLETEFSVVLSELDFRTSDPYRAALYRMLRLAYPWHPYGRSPLGTESDIRNVPIERLQAFYRRYYQPDNAMVMIAGRFEPTKALALVDRTLGAVPRPTRSAAQGNQLPAHYTVEPTQDGEHYSVVRRTGDSQWLVLGYHVPGLPHPDFAAVTVLADVLFSNPSGRLYKALVDTRRAVALQGSAWELGDPAILGGRVNLSMDQSIDSVRTTLMRMLDSARTSPYTDEEVTRAKTSLRRNMQLELNNSAQFAVEFSSWAAMGDWRLFFYHRDQIGRVTPADVRRVAGLYLKPSNLTTVAFIPTAQPDRAEIPRNPNVATLLAGYRGGAVAQTGEAFDATPKNIDARTTRVRLPNGMHLSMLPKETRGNRVVAQLLVRHGTEASLTGKVLLSQVTGVMLARGTTQLTRQQIIDSLSRLTSAVGLTSTSNSVTVTIETTRPNLMAVLDLVAQQLRAPRFDPEELERIKKARVTDLENSRANPLAMADLALTRRLAPKPPGHPLYRQTIEESIADINAITIDAVKAHYQSHFGASYADMSVIGDFDAAEVQAAVTRALGDWRNPQPFERLVRTYVRSDSAVESIELPDKPNAGYFLGATLNIRDDDPDYAALLLANYIFASPAGGSRIYKRLREKEGISYGTGGFLSVQSQDRFGTWQANAVLAPQNIERMQRAFREEIDLVLKDGFTPAEVEQFRAGLLQSRAQARANDPELAGILVNRRFAGRTMAYDEDLDRRIAALTAEQVTAAIRKYLNPKELVLVRAGSFAPKP